MANRLTLLMLLVTAHVPAALARRARPTSREVRGAEIACGAAGGMTGYFGGGQIYSQFTPPGMAYRSLRKPILSSNQRVALALAAAAAGTSLARVAVASDGPMADVVLVLGSYAAGIGDRLEECKASIDRRSRRSRERRERAARQDWLKANTKPARMMVPK